MTQRPDDWAEPVSIPEVDTGFDMILVPFDGSSTAELAIGWASAVATATNGEIVVLVVYDAPITARRRGGVTLASLQADLEAEANELATEAVEQLLAREMSSRGLVVRGDIADSILDTAERESADIIILGRRGLSHDIRSQGGRRELGHGSVADKVARNAAVPVLVVG